MTPSALELYDRAVASPAPRDLHARRADGSRLALALERWLGPLTAADEHVLDRARAPVLDIGCGPGRHVVGLARRRCAALGVDLAPAAVQLARLRGANVVETSVFAHVPGAGTWASALLLDGNIGIGGSPAALLARLRELLRSDGDVLVELERPGASTRSERLRLAVGGELSRPFAWATVAVDAIDGPAGAAGLRVAERWSEDGRWFARLVPAGGGGGE